ncbi:pyrimidine 5'-nucleotidase [Novispirillum sp. DQ9]|uniref:pyrimidine 5'-nucleotidase n=1 Tax=Novispirillum sp. DQ9 TaxID=3398612 RepID=UPI003C7A5EE0
MADPVRIDGPLDHLHTWLFDLDNTLYPATSSLFPQIDVRMTAFIADFLKLPRDEAFRVQKQYYRQYGTSLRGLMLEHGLEPDVFLDYVHDIDHTVLDHDPALDAALTRLPGRKLIFTNGSERHAERVLDRLGLGHHFEGIFDVRAAAYVPKPDPETYRAIIGRYDLDAHATAFFEDSPLNLKPAAEIGMTTILVRHGPDEAPAEALSAEAAWRTRTYDPAYCHHVTDDLTAWLDAAAAKLGR